MGFEGINLNVNAPGVPSSAPPPPPPPPPPPAAPQFNVVGTTAKGNPVGQFGNRLDTEAGRKKEAQMMADQQARIAQEAMRVAQSEASHGRESQTAVNLATQAAQQHQAISSGANLAKGVPGLKPMPNAVLKKPESSANVVLDAVRKHAAELPKPSTPPPTEPPPKPEVVQPTTTISTPTYSVPPPKPKIVKNPNRDVIDFNRDIFSASSISRLLFEQVGSIELVNIARRETIEGQNPYYTLISNLSSIRKNFDPTSLISRQKSNRNILDNYAIALNEKIPDQEYLDRNNLSNFYYIAPNGDLIIELDNLAEDEIIDLDIANSGTIRLVDES